MNKLLISPSSSYGQSRGRTGLILKILERHIVIKISGLRWPKFRSNVYFSLLCAVWQVASFFSCKIGMMIGVASWVFIVSELNELLCVICWDNNRARVISSM